jgi:hypothetical protein
MANIILPAAINFVIAVESYGKMREIFHEAVELEISVEQAIRLFSTLGFRYVSENPKGVWLYRLTITWNP